jgi:hypothetical protein
MSAAILGLAVVAVAVAASSLAWWRWERIGTFAGDVPLPPGTEVVRVNNPESEGEACSIVGRNRSGTKRLLAFYRSQLIARGWRPERQEEARARYRLGKRVLRLVLHRQKKLTVFTLHVAPCVPR